MKSFLPLLVSILLFSSCGAALVVDYEGVPPPERAFLESLLDPEVLSPLGIRLVSPAEAGKPGRADMLIEFYSSWEFEEDYGDIPLSRTWFVPFADALEGRRDIVPEQYPGTDAFIPLEDLAPPFTALRAGGKTVEDEGYPLVRVWGIRLGSPGPEKTKFPWRKGTGKKTAALETLLRKAPKPLIKERPRLFWIAAGGDLMLDRGAAEILFEEGPEGIFGGTAPLLAAADLTLVNLEGVVSDRGTRVKKSFNFRFSPKIAQSLKDGGIDGVLQANNHAFDFGMEAFLDSLGHLSGAGLGILGAGINDEAAAAPFLYRAPGNSPASPGGAQAGPEVRVYGIASFPREWNGWDGLSAAAGPDTPGMLHAGRGGAEKLKAHFSGPVAGGTAGDAGMDVDAGTPEGPVLDVVLFHGGVEWSRRPNAAARALYTDLIQNGADLIIGSHPHVVQGFEWIEGKPVFWSLGNYVFGGMENTLGGEEGLFITLGYLGDRLFYLEPYPLALTNTRTSIAPPDKLETFYRLSAELREEAP
ncbi:MAG: CapA family protein [Treponema sp.]|jgi:poly-gamma-glutamate synthesis protein (capsule biosynthesis protein)|nr:CapA family protein [Treponema sp.]